MEKVEKSLTEQREQRLRNLESLTERGFEPYPHSYRASHTAAALHATHPKNELTPGDRFDESVTVAGRVMLLRGMGKATFATLQDASGQLQAYFQKDVLDTYNALKKIDLGDWLEVSGTLFVTQTGELTVQATDFRPLVKSLRPTPRQVSRADRQRGALPSAPPRPAGLPRGQTGVRAAFARGVVYPPLSGRAGLFGGRDAGIAERSRREPKRARSSRTITRLTTTFTCESRSSCTSNV